MIIIEHIFRVPVDTKHFKDTIEDGKSYADLQPLLTPAEKEKVGEIATDSILRYWGSIAGISNKKTFTHVQAGDEILFYRNRKYIGVATLVFSTVNPKLARYSWGERKDRATWELVYFVKDVQRISVESKVINKAFGYKENAPVMGFSMVSEEIASQFVKAHGSVAKFIGSLKAQ